MDADNPEPIYRGDSDMASSEHRTTPHSSLKHFTWRDIISLTLGLGVLALVFIVIASLANSVVAYQKQDVVQNELITQQAHSINKLRDQVYDLGKTPVAEAPNTNDISKATQGPQGARGYTGDTGPQGSKGDKGDSGANGQTGPPGPTGASGQDGAPGTNGADGAAGAAGPPGPAGPTGASGSDGATYTPVSQECVVTDNGTAIQTTWQNSLTGDTVQTRYSAACLAF